VEEGKATKREAEIYRLPTHKAQAGLLLKTMQCLFKACHALDVSCQAKSIAFPPTESWENIMHENYRPYKRDE